MQSKPKLRYSPAFVHIKALSRRSQCSHVGVNPLRPSPPPPFYTRHFGRVPACVLKLYSARTPDVVSQLAPHLAVNYVYLEHPLHRHLSGPLRRTRAISRVKSRASSAIFRPAVTTRVRDLSWTDVCFGQTTTKRYNAKGIHRPRSRLSRY